MVIVNAVGSWSHRVSWFAVLAGTLMSFRTFGGSIRTVRGTLPVGSRLKQKVRRRPYLQSKFRVLVEPSEVWKAPLERWPCPNAADAGHGSLRKRRSVRSGNARFNEE